MKHSIQTNNAGLFITFKDNKIKNKIHHEKETRGQPYTCPKKGIKIREIIAYHYLHIHIFKTHFNPALNSLKDSALTTYCLKLFHSFTMWIKNEYLSGLKCLQYNKFPFWPIFFQNSDLPSIVMFSLFQRIRSAWKVSCSDAIP